MKVIGVIPARYGSTRLKAKVLADLLGKPVIQHVWERAGQSRRLDDLLIACDDERVLKKAKEFGAKAILTSKDHASGSDRIIEAVNGLEVDVVINIQGDEPLIHPTMIDDLARVMLEDSSCVMATVIKAIDNPKDIEDPNVVKVVIDENQNALYFSRSAIPYNREEIPIKAVRYYKHLGIYAYRKDFLMAFRHLPASYLEKAERLEQLRVLEAGYKIKTVKTKFDTIAVDTQADLKRVKAVLKKA